MKPDGVPVQSAMPPVKATDTVMAPPPEPAHATATEEMRREIPMGKLAFVKTDNRADGVRRALDLLEANPVDGKAIFLKPNFNSPDPTPGSTHTDLLRALVSRLYEMGATGITLGDRSGMGNTRAVMEALGIFKLGEELGFNAIVFDELDRSGWVKFETEGSHWRQGFAFPLPVLEADAIVQTCCLKTHQYGGHFTLSLKNSVGLAAKTVPGEGYNYMTELHNSRNQRLMIAEINTAYKPDLVILDGVEAFVEGGPASGKRVAASVVLAGSDRVAIDATGVAILRYFGTTPEVRKGKIFDQQQIARAAELGLGVSGPDQIELITGDPESEAYAAEIQTILKNG